MHECHGTPFSARANGLLLCMLSVAVGARYGIDFASVVTPAERHDISGLDEHTAEDRGMTLSAPLRAGGSE